MRSRFVVYLSMLSLLVGALAPTEAVAAANPATDVVMLVEPNGRWHIRVPGFVDYTFWYGMAGDVPLLGDWDGDGVDTPGMYRPTTGFVYLTNLIPPDGGVGFGDPSLTFFFGMAGDQVVVGDWDGDGADSLGIRRGGKMYLTNVNATAVAEYEFFFGVGGDVAFGGDPDGDGRDTIYLYRASSGVVYYTNQTPVGPNGVAVTADSFFYGMPGDRFVIGDWDGDGTDSVGIFRPQEAIVYLRNDNSLGPADLTYRFGRSDWLPVAGSLIGPYGLTSTSFWPITFATGVTEDDQPINVVDFIPSGTSDRICGFFDFVNMVDGTPFDALWYLNGEFIEAASLVDVPWGWGTSGNSWVCFTKLDGPLLDGTYELVLNVDGQDVRDEAIMVGGDHPTQTFELNNQSPHDICLVFLALSDARGWGADELAPGEVIPPDSSRVFELPAAFYDISGFDCHDNLLFEEFLVDVTTPHVFTFVG